MLEHIPPPDDRTLRERVDTAMKLSRELDEHLRQTLIPASQRVRRAAEEDANPVHRRGRGAGMLKVAAEEEEASPQQRDRAVRHAVDVLLEADRFASAKRVRLEQYCRSIRQTMRDELADEPK